MTRLLTVHTVSQVTSDIKNLVEDNFSSLWVSGQISNFKPAQSGHFYFTLKDDKAQMGAVMFRGANYRLKFKPEDGMEVMVHGRLSVYEPRGQYQLMIDMMEPKGLGALQLAFDQLKKRLTEEGLFDEAHKKEIPYLPRKIGLVTSSHGAVVHDMVTVLTRRFPNIEILIHPVRVQGDGAAEEIAAAIAFLNANKLVDVILVGRGGGSMEDLWAFNEEVLVRTVYDSDIPVISAVGHETDYTLCDLVADLRAPTPSAAAELAVPLKKDLEETLKQYREQIQYMLSQRLEQGYVQLSFLRKRLKNPRRLMEDLSLRLDDDSYKLQLAMKRTLQDHRHLLLSTRLALQSPKHHLRELRVKIDGLKNHLKSLSPMAALNRGYGVVFDKDKVLVRSIRHLKPNDQMQTRLADGVVISQVLEVRPLPPSSQ